MPAEEEEINVPACGKGKILILYLFQKNFNYFHCHCGRDMVYCKKFVTVQTWGKEQWHYIRNKKGKN